MNDADRELESLLGPLRDGPVALSGVGAASAERDRLLPGLRAAVERVPAQRRRARVVRRARIAGGGVLCSALALAALFAWRNAQPVAAADALRIEPGSSAMAWIDAAGMRREIKGALTLRSPGELVGARDAWSHVSTARGVQLELAPKARLRVAPAPQISDTDRGAPVSGLQLLQGEVHCRVPKLGKQKQFSIATPDAQVIVHGTTFSVAVSEAEHPTTCVRVAEGLVEVRSAKGVVFVGGGKQWGCAREAAPPVPNPSTAAAAAVKDTTAERAPIATPAPVQAPAPLIAKKAPARRHALRARPQPQLPDGTLDEENRLLESALSAERAGDLRQARKLFAQLLTRHPNSPLIPEARLGLARVR